MSLQTGLLSQPTELDHGKVILCCFDKINLKTTCKFMTLSKYKPEFIIFTSRLENYRRNTGPFFGVMVRSPPLDIQRGHGVSRSSSVDTDSSTVRLNFRRTLEMSL